MSGLDWDRVAVHVEQGIRTDQTISEVSAVMRADGAPRREIRTAVQQIVAAQQWADQPTRMETSE